MKRQYARIPKYQYGIDYATIGNTAGGFVNNMGTNYNGIQNPYASAFGTGLQMAGTGASIGMSVGGPMGAGIGAGAGLILGGIGGALGAKKQNAIIKEQMATQKAQEDAFKAQMEAQEREMKRQQQLNYSRSYYNAYPMTGFEGVGLYAMGGKLAAPVYAMGGGYAMPISSNVQQMVGKSHANGGIKLGQNGVPIAEVEGGETIVNGKSVISDRVKLPNGKTVADESIKIGKQIAKHEKTLATTVSTPAKNSLTRKIDILNKDLQNVIGYQEAVKKAEGIETGKMSHGGKLPKYAGGINDIIPEPNSNGVAFNPTGYSNYYTGNVAEFPDIWMEDDRVWNMKKPQPPTIPTNTSANQNNKMNADWGNAVNSLQYALPYLDNIYNKNLISKTPQLPTPLALQAYAQTPMTLKTNYNVAPQLNRATMEARMLNKNIDENTSNSAAGRANKLAGYATSLNKFSDIYGQKENIETQLKNQDSLNRQAVNAQNMANAQAIKNANTGALNNYNMQKFQRANDIQQLLSTNMKEFVGDATKQIQDRNMMELDNQRMLYDALQYGDAAGIARTLGTPSMNSIVTDINKYKAIEKMLLNRPQDLAKFYQLYGKKEN